MKNYVASGLVVFNLQTKQIVFNVSLGISQVLEADNLTYEKGGGLKNLVNGQKTDLLTTDQ